MLSQKRRVVVHKYLVKSTALLLDRFTALYMFEVILFKLPPGCSADLKNTFSSTSCSIMMSCSKSSCRNWLLVLEAVFGSEFVAEIESAAAGVSDWCHSNPCPGPHVLNEQPSWLGAVYSKKPCVCDRGSCELDPVLRRLTGVSEEYESSIPAGVASGIPTYAKALSSFLDISWLWSIFIWTCVALPFLIWLDRVKPTWGASGRRMKFLIERNAMYWACTSASCSGCRRACPSVSKVVFRFPRSSFQNKTNL